MKILKDQRIDLQDPPYDVQIFFVMNSVVLPFTYLILIIQYEHVLDSVLIYFEISTTTSYKDEITRSYIQLTLMVCEVD